MGKKTINTESLFGRVVKILEKAKSNVVRSINNNMVIAYWLIGKEIVLEIQNGKERAEYGKEIIRELSKSLQAKFGRGYSTTNLRYFRTFYKVYQNRVPEIRHIASGELKEKFTSQSDVLDKMNFAVTDTALLKGFSPNLSWSHYRELMKIENKNERLFYEVESETEFWDVTFLKNQIHTFYVCKIAKK